MSQNLPHDRVAIAGHAIFPLHRPYLSRLFTFPDPSNGPLMMGVLKTAAQPYTRGLERDCLDNSPRLGSWTRSPARLMCEWQSTVYLAPCLKLGLLFKNSETG